MTLRRDRGIEGIRGLAALAVVLSHLALLLMVTDGKAASSAGQKLVGEGVFLLAHGVTVFFVLSGYLLYRPFAAHLLGGRSPSARTFYKNRALRILPAYWVILAICGWLLGAVVVRVEEGASLVDGIGYLTDPLQIAVNATLLQGYTTATPGAIAPAWSLVPEVAFYALLPLLWLAARRAFPRQPSYAAALAPALALTVLGLVGFEISLHFLHTVGDGRLFAETWPSRLFHSFLATCGLFGLGMLVAASVARLAVVQPREQERRSARMRRNAVLLLAVTAVAYLPTRVLGQDRITVGVAASALVLLTVLPGPGRLSRAWTGLLESRPVNRAGVISYSVYLWHYPLTLFLVHKWPALGFTTFGGFLLSAAIIVPLVIALSELTYRLVERPALRRKGTVVPTGEPNAPAAARA